MKNKNSYLGRSGDAHLLVDALERNTVDLARAGDQKKTRVKHLQEDNALAAEAAAKKDQDLAGGDVLLEDGLGGLEGLARHGPILDEGCKLFRWKFKHYTGPLPPIHIERSIFNEIS